MSLQAIKEKMEELRKVEAQIRAAKAAENPDSHSEFSKKLDALMKEYGVDKNENAVNSAPTEVKAILEQNREREIKALALLEEMHKELESQIGKTKEVEDEITKLRAAQKEQAERRIEFDTQGRIRGAFDKRDYYALLETPTRNESIREMQKTASQMAMLGAFLRTQRATGHKFFVKEDIADVRQFKTYKKLEPMVRALYTTGSAAGDEIVPDILAAQMHEKYEMARRVEQFIPSIDMPAGEWSLPVNTSLPVFYLQGESSDDDAANYVASTPATSKVQYAAKKFAARIVWSDEIDEDSVVAMSGWVEQSAAKSFAGAIENVLINGDTSSTHLDTGYTVASNDQRRAWDGFRDRAIATSMVGSLATYSTANVMGLLAAAGEFAGNLQEWIAIPSVLTYLKYIVASSDYTTWEKVGQLAPPSNMSGSVGVYYGMACVPSGKLAQNLNATGLYDGSTTTKTAILFAKPGEWLMGNRKGFTVEVEKDIKNGQYNMVVVGRKQCKKLANASTGYTEVYGYNIA